MSDEKQAFLLIEYQALREEVLKRLEIRSQLVSLAVIAFGTVIGVGVQFHNPEVILVYPPLCFFLAWGWVTEERAIRALGTYIRAVTEHDVGVAGWEHVANKYRKTRNGYRRAVIGVFLSSEILAIGIASIMILPKSPISVALSNSRITSDLLNAESIALLIGLISLGSTLGEVSRLGRNVPSEAEMRSLQQESLDKPKD